MGDESWVYGYDPETRVQSSQWKSPSSPRATKARQSRSNMWVVMTVFFDLDGIVQAENVPRKTKVNCEYYKGLLARLGPPLWSSGQSFWLQIQRSRVRFPALPDFSE